MSLTQDSHNQRVIWGYLIFLWLDKQIAFDASGSDDQEQTLRSQANERQCSSLRTLLPLHSLNLQKKPKMPKSQPHSFSVSSMLALCYLQNIRNFKKIIHIEQSEANSETLRNVSSKLQHLVVGVNYQKERLTSIWQWKVRRQAWVSHSLSSVEKNYCSEED